MPTASECQMETEIVRQLRQLSPTNCGRGFVLGPHEGPCTRLGAIGNEPAGYP
jgi:hypothetical protein